MNLNSLQNDHSSFPTCDTQQGVSSSSYTKLQTKFHSASRSVLKRLGPKTRLLRMDDLNINILKRTAADMLMLMLNLFAPVHFFSLQFYNYSMKTRMFKATTKRIAYNLQLTTQQLTFVCCSCCSRSPTTSRQSCIP